MVENVTSTMVLHDHVDGAGNMFNTMPGQQTTETLGKWLVVIIRWTHQSASGDSRWEYDPI